jgi:glutamine amidotransferase
MFLLEIERNGNANLYYMNYFNRNYLQSKNISDIYYKMYIDNENGIAVYSSTINYYCNNKGKEVNEGIIEKIGEMKIKLGYNR